MKIITQDVRKLTMAGGTTYYVTIPHEMIRQLGWKKGEKKVIKIDGERIIISDWKKQPETNEGPAAALDARKAFPTLGQKQGE